VYRRRKKVGLPYTEAHCRAYSKDFVMIHTWRACEREPIIGVWAEPPGSREVRGLDPLKPEVFV